MRETKYFFEDEVFSDENYAFEHLFDEELLEQILILKEEGASLELACGEAGNSLALAAFGFDATCIDISKSAIKAVKKEAKLRKVKVNAISADLEQYKFNANYDVIIGAGFLHFFTKENAYNLLKQVKEHTKKGGINIIEVLIEGDETQQENLQGYYPLSKELKEIYSDWEILDYQEFDDFDEDEEYDNNIAKIVARKS